VPPARIFVWIIRVINRISEITGRMLAWLILVVVGILLWEVLLRGIFNAPTIWAHESSQYVFGFYFALGGAYALRLGSMVNVDILINKLQPRTRAILNSLAGLITIFFVAALLWKGIDEALYSIKIKEMSQTVWRPPIYPLKITVVLGAFLLGLQAVANILREFLFGISGREI